MDRRWLREPWGAVSPSSTSIGAGTGPVVLERGAIRVELALDPFGLDDPPLRPPPDAVRERVGRRRDGARPFHPVHRGGGRRRGAHARRARLPSRGARQLRRRCRRGADARRRPPRAAVGRGARGPRRSSWSSRPRACRCALALDWDRRSDERLVGLGARHEHPAGPDRADRPARRRSAIHRSRLPARDARRGRHPPGRLRADAVAAVQPRLRGLGPDRRQRHPLRPGRGAPVDLHPGGRGAAARDLLCAPSAAARLRQFCRRTGVPALLPEWGYGFWKSRDVYEHQDDALEDFRGFVEHRIPLDAIVLDSPWATQYNTWEFNPHQFPDAGDGDRAARRRRAHGRVGDTVGQRRLPRWPGPAATRVRAPAPRAGVQLRVRRRRPLLRP